MSLTKPPKRRGFVGGDDRWVDLPEGSLPCKACGVAVRTYVDTPVETFTINGPRSASGFSHYVDILVTRCDVCADRYEAAARILRNHPVIARENGNVGIDRLDAAMAALDVLGRTPRLAETLTMTDNQTRDLIASLAPYGAWSSWTATSAAPGACGSRRWGHVSQTIWADTRSEFARLLGRRVEVAKLLTPPARHGAIRGCAFCGVGTVLAKESDAYAAWGDELRIPLASLGGRGGEVLAHLCPTCRPALFASGAVGLPAAWLAVIRSRGYEPRGGDVVSLTGVTPWAALDGGAKPTSTPWEHVDLAALDRELMRTTVVRRVESDLPANPVIGWVK